MTYARQSFAPVTAGLQPTEKIDANHAAIEVTDFAGTVYADATRIQLVRAINSGAINNYRFAAPGARYRFGVIMPSRGSILLQLEYTGMITRVTEYNDVATVYVGGDRYADLRGPGSWSTGQPHPTGIVRRRVLLDAGTHDIEVMLPYNASVDFREPFIPATATPVAPTPRPSEKCIVLCDSIGQPFNASMVRKGWPHLLCEAKGWQQLNLSYGGRTIEPNDFAIAGALAVSMGAGRVITNRLINNCFGGDSAAAIEFQAGEALDEFRAAAPTTKLFWVNAFDCTSPGLVTPVATGRNAVSAAFTAKGGAHDFLIPGGTANGLPSSAAWPDKTHPIDISQPDVATSLAGQVS